MIISKIFQPDLSQTGDWIRNRENLLNSVKIIFQTIPNFMFILENMYKSGQNSVKLV